MRLFESNNPSVDLFRQFQHLGVKREPPSDIIILHYPSSPDSDSVVFIISLTSEPVWIRYDIKQYAPRKIESSNRYQLDALSSIVARLGVGKSPTSISLIIIRWGSSLHQEVIQIRSALQQLPDINHQNNSTHRAGNHRPKMTPNIPKTMKAAQLVQVQSPSQHQSQTN
jgi:hypothetical protein